jgi:hypothetical protein
MTKSDLQGAHKVADITTTAAFQAILAYLGENVPSPPQGVRDPTTIINDEGVVRGWNACVKELRQIATPTPKSEKSEFVPYSEPAITAKPDKK